MHIIGKVVVREIASESGATLITTLIILLIMSLLASTAMNTAFVDERMAANSHYQNRAYHLALSELEGQYDLAQEDHSDLLEAKSSNSTVTLTAVVSDSQASTSAAVRYLSTVNLPESSLGIFQGHQYEIDAESEVNVVNAVSDQSIGLTLAVPVAQ